MGQERRLVRIEGLGMVATDENVRRVLRHFANKEEYFTKDLKEERFISNQESRVACFLPSREDSLDRLRDSGEEFVCEQPSVEEQVVLKLSIEALFEHMSDREKRIVSLIFYQGKTEDEASEIMGMSRAAFRRERDAMLQRFRDYLEKSSW